MHQEYNVVIDPRKDFISDFWTGYCVQQTAAASYDVVPMGDCIGTMDDVQKRKYDMLSELQQRGGEIR